jgi:hypothetical protein
VEHRSSYTNTYSRTLVSPHDRAWKSLLREDLYPPPPLDGLADSTFPVGNVPFPHDPTSDFPKYEDPENPGHLLFFVADDAPLYLKWEAGFPTLAQEYRNLPESSFLSPRLHFYRLMHCWMFVTNGVIEGYKLLLSKALDLALDPCGIYLIQFLEKPATLSCDAWLEAYVEEESPKGL